MGKEWKIRGIRCGQKMKSECRNANAIAIVKVKLNALRQCLADCDGSWLWYFLQCTFFFTSSSATSSPFFAVFSFRCMLLFCIFCKVLRHVK